VAYKSSVFMVAVLVLIGVFLVACEPETDATPTSQPPQVTAVAVNPPAVWIDKPLPGESLILSQLPPLIVAHASGLSGPAILEIRDGGDAVLGTVPLGEPVNIINQGGLLAQYEGPWLETLLPFLENITETLIIKLVVNVDGVNSDPVILMLVKETNTPTITPSPTETVTPSATPTATATLSPTVSVSFTPTQTATHTLVDIPTTTPTHTPTSTPTANPTDTATFTDTPTFTATPTWTPSITPSLTPLPDIGFRPKEPRPCRLFTFDGLAVPVRVGPGDTRGVITLVNDSRQYEVTGYNNDDGTIWWEFNFTEYDRLAWVTDHLVYTTGSCYLLPYVPPPVVILRPTNTPVPPSVQVTINPEGPPGIPIIYYFYADHAALPFYTAQEELRWCTNLHWATEYVDGVFLNGEGVTGMEDRRVCMNSDAPDRMVFDLSITKGGNTVETRRVVIRYNEIPEPEPPTATPFPTRVPPTPTEDPTPTPTVTPTNTPGTSDGPPNTPTPTEYIPPPQFSPSPDPVPGGMES
jgi:hypothetical protein